MGKTFKESAYRLATMWVIMGLVGNMANLCKAKEQTTKWPANIQVVLNSTKPLKFDRGKRLPLYLWQAMNPGLLETQAAEKLVKNLDERGIGLISSWNPKNHEKSLAASLTIARAQKKLGLRVNINVNNCLYSFFNGDERTAHIDDQGKSFWDESFGKHKMGAFD